MPVTKFIPFRLCSNVISLVWGISTGTHGVVKRRSRPNVIGAFTGVQVEAHGLLTLRLVLVMLECHNLQREAPDAFQMTWRLNQHRVRPPGSASSGFTCQTRRVKHVHVHEWSAERVNGRRVLHGQYWQLRVLYVLASWDAFSHNPPWINGGALLPPLE